MGSAIVEAKHLEERPGVATEIRFKVFAPALWRQLTHAAACANMGRKVREMGEISRADERLVQRLQDAPDADFLLILRVSGDVAAAAAELQKESVEVRRMLGLIRAVAVRASGRQALGLLDAPWLIRMEVDSIVRAM